VELSQYWRDMLAPANASNEALGSILDSLKTLKQAVGVTPDNSELQWASRKETNGWTTVE